MAERSIFTKPIVEIDQDRYEELLKHEMQYEQYRQCADMGVRNIIETKEIKESEEKKK